MSVALLLLREVVMMAKYDWAELKKEFLLGSHASLSDFAKDKCIPNNGYFRKTTKGWIEEKRQRRDKKETKIIEKVTEQEIRYEIDRNTAHLAAGDLIMTKLNLALQGVDHKKKGALYQLLTAAQTLDKVQKSQRLGEGKRADTSLMESLISALEADANATD